MSFGENGLRCEAAIYMYPACLFGNEKRRKDVATLVPRERESEQNLLFFFLGCVRESSCEREKIARSRGRRKRELRVAAPTLTCQVHCSMEVPEIFCK